MLLLQVFEKRGVMYIEIYDNVKLNKGYDRLTSAQKDVHQYVLSNLENVKDVTVNEIATACFCSTTTVNRYCKKMGADGYSDLKYALLEYGKYNNSSHNTDLTNRILSKVDDLNLTEIDNVTKLISESSQVYLFGTGASFLHAQYLQRLLIRCGINAIATNEVHYLRVIENVPLCIVISHTGETFSSVQVAKQLREKCNVIALTKKDSRVHKLANYCIYHNEEVEVDDSIANETSVSIYLIIIALIKNVKEQQD